MPQGLREKETSRSTSLVLRNGAAVPWGCGDLKFGGYLWIATVMSIHIPGYCCQLQATGSSPLKAFAQAVLPETVSAHYVSHPLECELQEG